MCLRIVVSLMNFETANYMLTFRMSVNLEFISYSDLDFVQCVDSRKSTFDYLFLLWEEANKSFQVCVELWHALRPHFMNSSWKINLRAWESLRVYDFATIFFSKEKKIQNKKASLNA